MSLALSLGGADGKSGKPAIVAALADLVRDGISAEDVEALLKLTKVNLYVLSIFIHHKCHKKLLISHVENSVAQNAALINNFI